MNGTYLERAIAVGHAEITGEDRTARIRYIAADHSERWADPEEKVRAEFWAELIYKYQYLPERIDFEVNVPHSTPGGRADLVVFSDDELKAPYFIFECKPADASDRDFEKAINQACTNAAVLRADYCGAIAGHTRRFLRFDNFAALERDKNRMADIPIRYGKPPEWRFYKNRRNQDLTAVSLGELRVAIHKCRQTLWGGGQRSEITAFSEFSKLVFIKSRDENNLDRRDGEPYDFQRGDGETADDLATRINHLYDVERQREPDLFTDSINVEPPIMAQCVEHLESISLKRTELDTKGVAFEDFMGSHFKGEFGQYFTPRDLIAFCVAMLEPKRTDLVLDPTCGSGGFLLYALDYVRREADSRFRPDSIDHYRYWNEFAQNNLFGIDVNDEIARVAKMNMIVHDDGHSNIIKQDALDFPRNISAQNAGITFGQFDLILTNPPFGAEIIRSEKGDGYLEQFELRRYLGKKYPNLQANPLRIKTEIAFVERIHSFLKPGVGRAAVVLPDGILNNSSNQGVRQWMMDNFQILAVVSLPDFAFKQHGAGVNSSIVFLRRLAKDESASDDAPIFMAIAANIGYDATGRKTFDISVESEISRKEKVERHSCDLFDYRVTYEWSSGASGVADWNEKRREIIPGTGIVAMWRDFKKNPTHFLASTPLN